MRATGAGVAAALLTLLVLLRGLFALLDPVAPAVAQLGAGALIVFVPAVLGGVAGAWQAALAGLRSRREIVVVGAVGPGAAFVAVSLVLSIAQSVGPGRALVELVVVAAGVAVGAWLLPAVALLLARLRGERGQTSAEYMGALLLVAVIVAALLFLGPLIGERTSSAVEAIAGGTGQSGQVGAGNGPAVVNPTGDDDGDGLNNEEEATLGSDPVTGSRSSGTPSA